MNEWIDGQMIYKSLTTTLVLSNYLNSKSKSKLHTVIMSCSFIQDNLETTILTVTFKQLLNIVVMWSMNSM